MIKKYLYLLLALPLVVLSFQSCIKDEFLRPFWQFVKVIIGTGLTGEIYAHRWDTLKINA